MSVRWKPLIILSGLFAAFAVAGFLVFFLVFSSPDVEDILAKAREASAKNDQEAAKIYYLQALQIDARNPAIHQEMADFYASWLKSGKPANPEEVAGLRLRSLFEAQRLDRAALEPRRALLDEALRGDDPGEQAHWAKQVIGLQANDPDARYVLAAAALNATPPNLAEAQTHLDALEKSAATLTRTAWIEAQIAYSSSDRAALRAVLDRVRSTQEPANANPIDQLCRLRLQVIDFETATDQDDLAARAAAVVAQTEAILADPSSPTSRIIEISKHYKRLEAVQTLSGHADARKEVDRLAALLDGGFRKAIEAKAAAGLWIHQAYADYLASQGNGARCLEIVNAALATPIARESAHADEVVRLHETALKVALADTTDPKRYEKADPHLRGLMEAPRPEHQGLGYLYKGAIALELSGMAGEGDSSSTFRETAARQLAESRELLKNAASRLPQLATAQALYGVSLILSGEQALGRQYLQTAQRLGSLEARYQVWAAWSMLRAGYPEEAEPIVGALEAAVESGDLPADLSGTLRLLRGEIAQARRSPQDLEIARTAFQQAADEGGEVPPGVAIRLAELAVAIDGPEKGLEQVEALRASGKGGDAAEHLTVTTLIALDRADEAREILAQARSKYPDSAPLASLDAGLLLRDEKPDAAEALLAEFLNGHPDQLSVAQLRARILFDELDRPDDARQLLQQLAEKTENSAPLVQLALLDLTQGRYTEAAQSIAKVRGRWPEAAVGDMLDAQLSLARQDLASASRHLDAALQKDPKNKIALFWKAQIEDRSGDAAEAARMYEQLVRSNSVKQLMSGLSLGEAAQWAMASQALKSNDLDGAIQRYESMLQEGTGNDLDRVVRWKLVSTRAAKGDWATARREITELLQDPEVSLDERVQAANLFYQKKETATADAQIDYVLKKNPRHPGAVVLRALQQSDAKKYDEAATLLRGAIDGQKTPVALYLMLAGVENARDPNGKGADAAIEALDQGLEAHPTSAELVKARYGLIRTRDGVDAALKMARERLDADSSNRLRPLLVQLYREENRLNDARALVEAMVKEEPRNAKHAATLIALLASQSVQAGSRNDTAAVQAINLETDGLIKQFRQAFPDDIRFVQAECELAVRQGDFTKADAITRKIDEMDPNSPVAPILRAMLYERQGWMDRAAQAYVDALSRNPGRDDLRLKLASLQIELGRPAEARIEATNVLEKNPANLDAMLVLATALAEEDGPESKVAQQRKAAIEMLQKAIEGNKDFLAAYQKIAEIQMISGNRNEAIAALQANLEVEPADSNALALLIEYLCQPESEGSTPSSGAVEEAVALATRHTQNDAEGFGALAAGIGFYKAAQYPLALEWTEKAAEKLDNPIVHSTLGDLLLTMAEAESDKSAARALFERSVAEYDRVLAVEANRVEAVNNKAWILHQYLGRDQEALTLCESFLARVERNTLPGEFFDTVGSIHESLGHMKQAEDAYAEGLLKSPDHPILNYHMGRLIAADPTRSARAGNYLEKALNGQDQLTPDMVSEVNTLLVRVGR